MAAPPPTKRQPRDPSAPKRLAPSVQKRKDAAEARRIAREDAKMTKDVTDVLTKLIDQVRIAPLPRHTDMHADPNRDTLTHSLSLSLSLTHTHTHTHTHACMHACRHTHLPPTHTHTSGACVRAPTPPIRCHSWTVLSTAMHYQMTFA
jgi:hypothetical protein